MNINDATNETATVFVIDDDSTSLKIISELTNSVGIPSKTFGKASEFLASYDPITPGCMVTDLRLPDISGLQLIEELRKQYGACPPTIIMSGYADVPTAVDAMKRGAIDFLEKPFQPQVMLDCIQRALREDSGRRTKQENTRAMRSALGRLTDREREVLDHLLAGEPNKEIAFKLNVSHKTVATHRANILQKMGVTNLVDLVKHLDELRFSK